MKTVHIYAVDGRWFFQVLIGSRVVVLGWSASREHAERETTLV